MQKNFILILENFQNLQYLGLIHRHRCLWELGRQQGNKFLTILTENETKLYVDPVSEMNLLGTSIDYITEDYTIGQFENKFIFNVNKELMTTCGCGTSFTPKNT